MNRLLEWLLDLRDIRLGRDAPLLLKWDALLEPWMLFAIGLVALVWCAAHYRREQTTVPRRVVLAAMRCALIALVIVALCQPSLVLQRDRVEPSHVAVLVDTSMSMSGVDRFSDPALAEAIGRGAGLKQPGDASTLTRFELGRRIFTRDNNAPLTRLLVNNGVQLETFDASVNSLGFAWTPAELDAPVNALSETVPDGDATDLARAITETIDRARGRRLAAIVLVSDCRHTQSTPLGDALDLAADRQIPIYPIRIGSPDRRFDLEVGPLRAQEAVFANDIMVVEAQVTATGLEGPTSITLRMIDETTSAVVATENVVVTPSGEPLTVELRTKPSRTGRISYRVETRPLDGEVSPTNNADRVLVAVLDERVKVLYVEGYPRYEYRYLKNALMREPTIDVSVILLEADDQFVQEGTDPIRRFPETPDELDRYDVVLFGDVDPRSGWLSRAQEDMLIDFVARKGGGFGLIAGERAAPRFFENTPLERLIPIRIDPTFLGKYDAPLSTGYSPRLTVAGRTDRLFRFTVDQQENERMFAGLLELYWIARTLGPRPGATVLAEHPTMQSAFGPMPLIVTGRYGAGKIFFHATDDTWRWRRLTGETLHDAYWVQVVRSLMRAGRIADDRRYTISTDRRSYAYGSPIRVSVDMLDAALLAEQRDEVEVSVTAVDLNSDGRGADPSSAAADPTAQRAGDGDLVQRLSARRIGEQSRSYEASVIPPRPGRFVLEVTDVPPRVGERRPTAVVRVRSPDLEMRRPEADYDALERIAVATSGKVIEPDRVDEAFASIPDRKARIPDDVIEPLWDSTLIFGLFVLMISAEWVLRKTSGLM